jgi:hypothetical protein
MVLDHGFPYGTDPWGERFRIFHMIDDFGRGPQNITTLTVAQPTDLTCSFEKVLGCREIAL